VDVVPTNLLPSLVAGPRCHRSAGGPGSGSSADEVGVAGAAVAHRGMVALRKSSRTRQVRRRMLEVQLKRLLARVDYGTAADCDAAARAVRLLSRLKHDDIDW
jgi:hypothetical protein